MTQRSNETPNGAESQQTSTARLAPTPMTEAASPPIHSVKPEARDALSIRHLWHRFGQFEVLKDVSFSVAAGEIFGFIGPNGAGKTTTIRILATLLEPMAGRIEIDGIDVALQPEQVRRLIGYMPDYCGVYERVSVREYLDFFARATSVPDLGVVDAVLELVELHPVSERLVSALSKGMRQRLQVARILLHDPKILILDEPASDLDPRARIEMRDLLLELRDLGKTIFLSSHILTELSDVCTSIGILEHGRLLVHGPIEELSERLAGHGMGTSEGTQPSVSVESCPEDAMTRRPSGGLPKKPAPRRLKLRVLGDANAVVPLLSGGQGILGVQTSSAGHLLVHYVGGDAFVAQVVGYLVSQGIGIVAVEPERNQLERIFLEATRGGLA